MGWQQIFSILFLAQGPPCGTASAAKQTVSVGTYEIKPVIEAKSPDQGCLARFVRDAFAAACLPTQLHWIPWNRLFNPKLKNDVKAMFPMVYSDKRAQSFIFSEPLMAWDRVACHVRSRPFTWKTYDDFKGKHIVYERGSYFGPLHQYVLDNKLAKLTPVDSDLAALKMLLTGRADLFFCSVRETEAELKALQQQRLLSADEAAQVITRGKLIFTAPFHVAFPKFKENDTINLESLELRAAFNQGLAKLKSGPSRQREVCDTGDPHARDGLGKKTPL